MHEFSIAGSLVDSVVEELGKIGDQPPRLLSARVAIGRMHQIVPDTLEFAYSTLIQDTPAKGSRLEIRHVATELECQDCGWKGAIKGIFSMCSECEGTNVTIIRGKEMYLENLEVEQD